jgi:hypothetical protein
VLDGGAAASQVPPLLEAVRATVTALEARAWIYRWAIIGATAALLGPVFLSLILMSWRPMPWVAVVIPIVGAFLVVDGRAVLRWQRHLLASWLSGHLRLTDLRQTLGAMKHLPAGTLVGMLDRLPSSEPPQQLDELPMPARVSVAERCLRNAGCQDRRTLLATIGMALCACSAAGAVSFRVAAPLLAAPVGLLLIVCSRKVGGGPDI